MVAAAVSVEGALQGVGRYMQIARFFRHVLTGPWTVRRHFSARDLEAIEASIKESESTHGAEIRFCVEAALDSHELRAGLSPRQRAEQVFAHLRVWDTAGNNGVLFYLLLADRDFEIVADRAVARVIPDAEWQAICREVEDAFRSRKFMDGVTLGLRRISDKLRPHFPPSSRASELSNRPVVM